MRVCTLMVAAISMALAGCDAKRRPLRVDGGDAAQGERLVTQFQCGSCHAIPGIPGATGGAGPSLAAYGRRSYIAGRIPNQPESLTQWLVDPPAMKPGTMMPRLGISPADARHMAAYLYSVNE